MSDRGEENRVLRYKRAKFVARFPLDRRYVESHFWLLDRGSGRWRLGYTQFAIRMLGELVDADFEIEPGDSVETGQVIGWLEGFKAVTDLYAVMPGVFQGMNPALETDLSPVKSDPYGRGWLYEIVGEPGADWVGAETYAAFLDGTIDGMMGASGEGETE